MATDAELLASLARKNQLLIDRVTGLAYGNGSSERFGTGMYIYGNGGTGKSYIVEMTLRALDCPYKLTNARVSGPGLYEILNDGPDLVHVLDDVEGMFTDKISWGILKAALWGQPGDDGKMVRAVGYGLKVKRREFVFSGAVVVIANVPIDDLPGLRPIKTRIPVIHHAPTFMEIAALIRSKALGGATVNRVFLSKADCVEVAAFVIGGAARAGRNLDIRLFMLALQDLAQWRVGGSKTHWKDLVTSRILEQAVSVPTEEPAARQTA